MEDGEISWVRRAKFSQTVCRRLDSVTLSTIPVSVKADRRIARSRPGDSGSCSRADSESKASPSGSVHKLGASSSGKLRAETSSKSTRRSLSPARTSCPAPDPFKEAKSEMKRFSTPHPRRKDRDKDSVVQSLPGEARGCRLPNLRSPARSTPSQNLVPPKTSWAGCFDQRAWGGRVTAVECMEEWRGDLSKLYIGLKFASGGHSKLYHGVYEDQPVAVKVITLPDDDEDGSMAARLEEEFSQEVNILSRLYHRNVIKLVVACRTPSAFCIITEFLCGGTLRAFLHKLEHRSLPLPRLVSIALDIARGMEYIHAQGLVHRDLKPENIIFDEECTAKIADFGIACEEAFCDALSDDSGTYRWMAPEMIRHKPYSRKVDVYSFGLLLWEMLTGRVPHEDMMPIQAAFAVVDKNLRPVIPADSPPALRALIERCWSPVPEKRPEFSEIVKILEQFQSALARDGTLNLVQKLTRQDHNRWLLDWIQKLKPLKPVAPRRS